MPTSMPPPIFPQTHEQKSQFQQQQQQKYLMELRKIAKKHIKSFQDLQKYCYKYRNQLYQIQIEQLLTSYSKMVQTMSNLPVLAYKALLLSRSRFDHLDQVSMGLLSIISQQLAHAYKKAKVIVQQCMSKLIHIEQLNNLYYSIIAQQPNIDPAKQSQVHIEEQTIG